jgi:hypothetical protein
VIVSVPTGTVLPRKADCRISPNNPAPNTGTLADKIKAWFKSLTH